MLKSSQLRPDQPMSRGEADRAEDASRRYLAGPFVISRPMSDPSHLWIASHDTYDDFRIVRYFRAVGGQGLARILLALGCVTALIVLAPSSNTPLEATAQMELIATQMERVRVVPPATRNEIVRVMSLASYDCDRARCRPQLEQRNRAVRDRLKSLLSTGSRNEKTANGNEETIP